jgi:hypothetical protein
VPIAVNELFDVTHLPAIYGSHALAGAVVSADAEVISALGPPPARRTGTRKVRDRCTAGVPSLR